MHISESHQSPPALAKCSKMTEDVRHGLNGNSEGATKDGGPRSAGQGGRLKFFKDGKFILELERAREGERMSWVSVPRKTFWPPQGTAPSTPSYRQETLSVSDDNSSVQSSPFQRDHSWKQTTPKRNCSKRLAFFYKRRGPQKLHRGPKASRKRRRPYSASPEPKNAAANSKNCKNAATNSETVAANSKNAATNSKHATANSKSDVNSCENEVNSCKNAVSSHKVKPRRPLGLIVQVLMDKMGPCPGPTTPPRAEMVVSPRKRILREMEKDNAHVKVDDACQKRSRGKVPQAGASTSSAPSPAVKVGSPVRANGTSEEVKTSRTNSYSITSLLAEDRTTRRSPDSSPSHFGPPQYCSPPPEDRWYSESVDKLRSIELSQVDKRAFSAYSPYPYMPHYVYPYSLPPYYYGRGYVQPPVYSAPHLAPLPVRPDVPTCSWNSETSRDQEHRDDNIPDMPLNLSKHAG